RVCRPSPAARRRFIFIDGKLRALPSGPASLLGTDLLSAAGKWRLVKEPFTRTPPPPQAEPIPAFAPRPPRPQVPRRIPAPGVLGVFAGDAAALSMRSTFPRIAALEAEHGSVVRGMKAARKAGQSAGLSVSFPDGLEELPRALAARLEGRILPVQIGAVRR